MVTLSALLTCTLIARSHPSGEILDHPQPVSLNALSLVRTLVDETIDKKRPQSSRADLIEGPRANILPFDLRARIFQDEFESVGKCPDLDGDFSSWPAKELVP